jgi:hypothetical protein
MLALRQLELILEMDVHRDSFLQFGDRRSENHVVEPLIDHLRAKLDKCVIPVTLVTLLQQSWRRREAAILLWNHTWTSPYISDTNSAVGALLGTALASTMSALSAGNRGHSDNNMLGEKNLPSVCFK